MKIQKSKNFRFDGDIDESIVRIIADPVFNKIILFLKKNPASIEDISKEMKLQKTTIQKRVNILLKLCLIEAVDDTKTQGIPILYQSNIQDICIEFKNKKLDVKISHL